MAHLFLSKLSRNVVNIIEIMVKKSYCSGMENALCAVNC